MCGQNDGVCVCTKGCVGELVVGGGRQNEGKRGRVILRLGCASVCACVRRVGGHARLCARRRARAASIASAAALAAYPSIQTLAGPGPTRVAAGLPLSQDKGRDGPKEGGCA